MKINFITPHRYDEISNAIMDVQPIATKEEEDLGKVIDTIITNSFLLIKRQNELHFSVVLFKTLLNLFIGIAPCIEIVNFI